MANPLKQFDDWVEVTGVVTKGTSYYYELRSFIKDHADTRDRLAYALRELRAQSQKMEGIVTDASWVVNGSHLYSAAGDCVGQLTPGTTHDPRYDANMRLIAAASELRERLQELVDIIDDADARCEFFFTTQPARRVLVRVTEG